MDNKLFRKNSLERVSSPEQLNDYVKVSSPGIWIILAAVIVLLIGACVWGIWGRLETTVPAVVISKNGTAVCCCDTSYIAKVEVGMTVRVSERELIITSISSQETKLYDYAPEAGFGAGPYGYISELSGSVSDGIYQAEIVVESVSPMSFLWN